MLSVCIAAEQARALPTRDQIVAAQKHQEDLIRSIECRFQCVHSPTPDAVIPLVKEVFRRAKDDEQYLMAVYSTKDSASVNRTYQMHWWRKGVKERRDMFGIHDDPTKSAFRHAKAFDGQIVRSASSEHKAGSVQTVQKASWDQENIEHPSTFLYRYFEVPFSTVFANAKEFKIDTVEHAGLPHTRVHLRHEEPKLAAVLIFDEQNRLVERQEFREPTLCFLGLDPDRTPVMAVKHTFSNYRPYPDGKGETIWFPTDIVHHYYIGRLLDGSMLNHATSTFLIHDIKFNVDIPDELFHLKIPKDYRVYDGVSGLGFLEPGVRPESVFPEEARRRRQWYWGVGIAGLVVVAVGSLVYIRWRRRTRAVTFPATRITP